MSTITCPTLRLDCRRIPRFSLSCTLDRTVIPGVVGVSHTVNKEVIFLCYCGMKSVLLHND
jgi:hypothetical protein